MFQVSSECWKVFLLEALKRRGVVVLFDRNVDERDRRLLAAQCRCHHQKHVARWNRHCDERPIAAACHRQVKRRLFLFLRTRQLVKVENLVASLRPSSVDEDTLVELLLLRLGRRHVITLGWVSAVVVVVVIVRIRVSLRVFHEDAHHEPDDVFWYYREKLQNVLKRLQRQQILASGFVRKFTALTVKIELAMLNASLPTKQIAW